MWCVLSTKNKFAFEALRVFCLSCFKTCNTNDSLITISVKQLFKTAKINGNTQAEIDKQLQVKYI